MTSLDTDQGAAGHSPAGSGAAANGAGPDSGYSPARTLPLRVEAIRQLRRRRTMLAFGVMLGLPWILAAAFELGGPTDSTGTLPSLATVGGLNFAAFSLSASTGFLLVVAVALFCGDTVASEASWSSLRYLLAAPVPRARLLRQKLTVALGYSLANVVIFPVMSLAAGTALYGWHPLRLPGSLVDLPPGTALERLGISLAYVLITLLFVAGLAFLLSVTTDSPLGAVGGTVGLAIVSTILDSVTALGNWREILPTHWQYSWLSALQPQLSWDPMIEGAIVSVSYAVVLLALAFRRFQRKDIVS
jgi:ABC-2 type transport system permease protein